MIYIIELPFYITVMNSFGSIILPFTKSPYPTENTCTIRRSLRIAHKSHKNLLANYDKSNKNNTQIGSRADYLMKLLFHATNTHGGIERIHAITYIYDYIANSVDELKELFKVRPDIAISFYENYKHIYKTLESVSPYKECLDIRGNSLHIIEYLFRYELSNAYAILRKIDI